MLGFQIYCGCPTYADDALLLATLPTDLQTMLDVVSRFAHTWRYSFNTAKSCILVFGESSRSRSMARQSRSWLLSGAPISEADSVKHLGITMSVSGSSLLHTSRAISQARSSFFALQAMGSRFGCVHPLTALKLVKALPLSLLQFGLEVIHPTNSELTMMERGQRTMLRAILGLPVRAPALGIHSLLGTLPVQLLVQKRHLSFLHAVLSLPDSAISKRLLLARCHLTPSRGFPHQVVNILSDLDLPSVVELNNSLPSKAAWKAHIKSILYLSLHELLLDSSSRMSSLTDIVHVPSRLDGRPLPLMSAFKGEVSFTRLSNFRWRLLLHCAALNQDTSVFHPRLNRSRDPSCPCCAHPLEDAEHFICSCPALQDIRVRWLPVLGLDSSHDLLAHVFGQKWHSDPLFQRSIIRLLFDLRVKRQSFIHPT